MKAVCICIMLFLWAMMILMRVIFRKDFCGPIGSRELRYTTGEWAGWFVFSSFIVFFSLLFSPYFGLLIWIVVICAMFGIFIVETQVLNWKIVYTDSEFIFRNTFRTVSKYSYEEILDICVLQPESQKYYWRRAPEFYNAQVKLQMSDCVIRFESSRNDGKFLMLLLRKKNGLK